MRIDELVLEFALDPTKFSAGQRKVIADMRRLEEEARRRAAEVERRAAVSLDKILSLQRTVAGAIAALLGGRALTEFIGNITQIDRNIGAVARNFQGTVGQVSEFTKAVELSGGTATEGAEAFAKYSQAIFLYRTRGAGPELITLLGRISQASGVVIDITKPMNEQFKQTQDALARIADLRGTFEAFQYAVQLGFSPGAANLVARGTRALREYREEARATGLTTEQSAAVSDRYQRSLTNLSQAIDNLGRSMTPLIELITSGVNKLAELFARWSGFTPKTEEGKGTLHERLERRFGPSPLEITPDGGFRLRGSYQIKPGAGTVSPAVDALARDLTANVPGIERFTAFNDAYHSGTGSAHAAGLAADLTLTDPSKSAEVAAAIRARLTALGIEANVIDEYLNPSGRSTGGHIHVGFGSEAAAARFRELYNARSPGGETRNTHTSSVNIGTVVVNSQAQDAEGVARDIAPAIKRAAYAMLANSSTV